MSARGLALASFSVFCSFLPACLDTQTSSSTDEIPIERCDRLPVVRARIGATQVRFLLDTGATMVLNVKSFAGGHIKEIQVTGFDRCWIIYGCRSKSFFALA